MGLHELGNIADYVRYLRENPQESELLFKELLIGVTSFFQRSSAACGAAARRSHSRALLAAYPWWRDAACVERWLLHGRRSLFAGHSLQGGAGESCRPAKRTFGKLQISSRSTSTRHVRIDKARAPGYNSRQHQRADVSEERLRQYFAKYEHGGFLREEGDPARR